MQHQKLKKAKLILESSFDTNIKSLPPPLKIYTDLAIIISDVHIPFHSKPWLEKALVMAYDLKKLYPKKQLTLVIAGDFLDFTMFSQYGKDARDSNFRKAIGMGTKVLDAFAQICDEIAIEPGNHDYRMVKAVKKMTGGFGFQEIVKLLTADTHFSPKMKFTERNVIHINDQWAAVHPVSYSKIPGKVGLDLAVRHQMNIINGHTHHPPAIMPTPCGKFVALENGCMQNSAAAGYLQNLTLFGQHMCGFTVLKQCSDKMRFKQISEQDIRL